MHLDLDQSEAEFITLLSIIFINNCIVNAADLVFVLGAGHTTNRLQQDTLPPNQFTTSKLNLPTLGEDFLTNWYFFLFMSNWYEQIKFLQN